LSETNIVNSETVIEPSEFQEAIPQLIQDHAESNKNGQTGAAVVL
jgi:hypothetical protein